MATGNYGVVRPADISPNDCEIFVHYTPTRENTGNVKITKIDDPNTMLIKVENPNNSTSDSEIFGGLYTLRLNTTDFGSKGIYTIVIKPVEIRAKINDCGVLSAYPNIRGLVFDIESLDSKTKEKFRANFENGELTGYRIEYINTKPVPSERKIPNFFRVITSNNKAESVSTNVNNSNQKANRYRFNDNSSLTFVTLSPSSAPNVKPNALPYIGSVGQEVILTNTFFNPIMIEVEMVEHDIETLAYGLFGPQTKSLEDGVYTVYNFDDEIYKQSNLYEIKDKFTGKPLFEVREPKTTIDFTKQFNDIATV